MGNCLRPSLNFWVQMTAVMKSPLGLLLEASRKHVIGTCFLGNCGFARDRMSHVAVAEIGVTGSFSFPRLRWETKATMGWLECVAEGHSHSQV
jgi:hypothetical protein